jgi:peptidoglycan-associated lipoprotein
MKMMKLTYLLAFALAVTLADTGCKNHRPTKVTQIRGRTSMVGEPPDISGTLPPGEPIRPGGGKTADIRDFEGMDADRAALAAHTVYFAYDSAVVKKSEGSKIQAVASALNSDSSAKLLIEGNCDERGTEEYNRALGERRALALREALAKAGVDPMRIRTISYGKDKPADPANNEAAWAKNRRGDFVLLHPKSGS